MTIEAQQSRVDAMVRLLGVVILLFGILMIYYTYANSGVASIAPEIITINYSLGILMTIVGAFATLAKFK
ncbi:MAG: hypothetical protein JRN21_01290 [Nitrososphaerota archaeon]|nr:hypothetical protein [Nitrososphaerota archaeon]